MAQAALHFAALEAGSLRSLGDGINILIFPRLLDYRDEVLKLLGGRNHATMLHDGGQWTVDSGQWEITAVVTGISSFRGDNYPHL